MTSRRFHSFFLLLAAAWVLSCRGTTAPPTVHIDIVVPQAVPEGLPSSAWLHSRTQGLAIAQQGWRLAGDAAVAPEHWEGVLGVVATGADEDDAVDEDSRWEFSLRLTRKRGRLSRELFRSVDRAPEGSARAAQEDLFQAALAAFVEEGAQLPLLARAPLDALRERRARDGDSGAAFWELVERGQRDTVPGLLQHLVSPYWPLRHRAILSLLALRARDAVGPLIEAFSDEDVQGRREILYTLGQLGGDDAEAFLFTVAQGHEDEGVRDAAQLAFGQLQRRMTKTSGRSSR